MAEGKDNRKHNGVIVFLSIAAFCALFGVIFFIEELFPTAAYEASQLDQRVIKPPLASGWDERAEAMYAKETSRLKKELEAATGDIAAIRAVVGLDKGIVSTVHTKNSGPIRYFDANGWARKNIDGDPTSWEARTFNIFSKVLPHSSYFVDFGTWMGPTLLYATQFVDISLGIEADPVAFAQLSFNLGLNSDAAWAGHTHLQPGAVGAISEGKDEGQTLEMQSSFAGSSCSGLAKVYNCGDKKLENYQKWNVKAYSLQTMMKHYGIPAGPKTFIKVDVESYECALIPFFLDWFKNMKANEKPSMYLSFHGQISRCTDDVYEKVVQFSKLYNHVDCGQQACTQNGSWKATDNIEVLFSDVLPSSPNKLRH